MTRGRAHDRPDPKFDAFLDRQTCLLDLSRPDRAALNLLLARTASGSLHG